MEKPINPIYRFFDYQGAFATITENKLRFTRMDCLNDPIDGSALIFKDAFKKYHRKLVRNNYSDNPSSRKILDEIADEIFNKEFEVFKKTHSRLKYTCSFSKQYKSFNSFLLWSYYANKHKGICIEFQFDGAIPFFPVEIVYPDLLEPMDESFFTDKNAFKMDKVLMSKAKYWEHEEEIRIITMDLHLKLKGLTFEYSGDNNEYLKIPLDGGAITKVILGCEMPSSEEEGIIKVINNSNSEIQLEKMHINEKTLRLESRPI